MDITNELDQIKYDPLEEEERLLNAQREEERRDQELRDAAVREEEERKAAAAAGKGTGGGLVFAELPRPTVAEKAFVFDLQPTLQWCWC